MFAAQSGSRLDERMDRIVPTRARSLAAVTGRLGAALLSRAQSGLSSASRRGPIAELSAEPSRGVAFVGTVWRGADSQPAPGYVIVDKTGRIADIHTGERPQLPHEILVLGGAHHWVLPGIVDAHVHLGFDPAASGDDPSVSGLATGLVGVRDLGAPSHVAFACQTRRQRPRAGMPRVAVSGPVLTARDGYPSRSWGRECSQFVTSPAQARSVVRQLASEGVDLIKVALESGSSALPVLAPKTLTAIVDCAHQLGLPVVAHALTNEMVGRALDSRVDELAHTPTERLTEPLIERIAASGTSVTSTLQTFFSDGAGREAADNAADLVAAGVTLRYGTDLGNTGTRTGVDPRELDRLADTGLGRLGALRAATEHAATAPGMKRLTGTLVVGQSASLALLPFSPLLEPGAWRTPSAVFTDARLTVGATPTAPAARI